jgi:phage baseplate assembly protein W
MASTIYGITPTKQTVKSITQPVDDSIFGLRFPLGKESILFKKSSRRELLKGQITQLIFTSPGERVFLPNFGVDLRSYVFEQLDDSLIANLQQNISNQIRLYVPNAQLVNINVKFDSGHYAGIPTLVVYLSVKEKETNEIIPLEFAT